MMNEQTIRGAVFGEDLYGAAAPFFEKQGGYINGKKKISIIDGCHFVRCDPDVMRRVGNSRLFGRQSCGQLPHREYGIIRGHLSRRE